MLGHRLHHPTQIFQWCQRTSRNQLDASPILGFGLNRPNRESRRADSNRLPLLITSELSLLDENHALHHVDLRSIYWTATKVKVGTICVYEFYWIPESWKH